MGYSTNQRDAFSFAGLVSFWWCAVIPALLSEKSSIIPWQSKISFDTFVVVTLAFNATKPLDPTLTLNNLPF